MRYGNRTIAGIELAERLLGYKHHAVVYAIARGGVAVGAEVARILEVPLDVIVTNKISREGANEYAVGAVGEAGSPVWNELEETNLSSSWKRHAVARVRQEVRRRRLLYTSGHRHMSAVHKTALVVDDGIATGMTMVAAIREIARYHPLRIVVAVPCAPREAIDKLIQEADEVIVLNNPDTYVGAVSAYYDDFAQLRDSDVIELVHQYKLTTARPN
ncbi:MAG TPA: phosphoribosyltransferase family protein [Candidatus Saccharimonadales bacterium]|nr:phosphoribosyltransferase family protein [Candidatus Saccharimonadales bacterium]